MRIAGAPAGWAAAELPAAGRRCDRGHRCSSGRSATAATQIKRLAVQTHAKAGWLALLRGDLAAATDAPRPADASPTPRPTSCRT
jgi:hypothetical protein